MEASRAVISHSEKRKVRHPLSYLNAIMALSSEGQKDRRELKIMLQIDDAKVMLQKLRQIRQSAGEMIAFLEHALQLQGDKSECFYYNPDEYLERIAKRENSSVHSSSSENFCSAEEKK